MYTEHAKPQTTNVENISHLNGMCQRTCCNEEHVRGLFQTQLSLQAGKWFLSSILVTIICLSFPICLCHYQARACTVRFVFVLLGTFSLTTRPVNQTFM